MGVLGLTTKRSGARRGGELAADGAVVAERRPPRVSTPWRRAATGSSEYVGSVTTTRRARLAEGADAVVDERVGAVADHHLGGLDAVVLGERAAQRLGASGSGSG